MSDVIILNQNLNIKTLTGTSEEQEQLAYKRARITYWLSQNCSQIRAEELAQKEFNIKFKH